MLDDPILTDAASMIVRWIHVVAGIAWIGSSFYFIHLDLSLQKRGALPAGVQGDAWQVHGGGFYQMVKFMVAPAAMPEHLTWFKWEAYATWLSGFGLLTLVYYLNAEMFLIDKAVLDISATSAVLISVGALALGWLVYDVTCRFLLYKKDVALSLVGYVFIVGVTYGLTHIYSGRGAFVQIGAFIGTIMVANVFFIIIPFQKKSVAALIAGKTPDPEWNYAGKQRSVHNNYLTLPVVLLMISNHYPLLYATKYNWVIVAIILLLGPVIRHFYNSRHAGHGSPWWTWGVAAAGIAVIVWLSMAGPRDVVASRPATTPSFDTVSSIVSSRCSMCHAQEPLVPGIAAAPGGVMLDNDARIRQHAKLIELYAARSNAMPPGNITEMTSEERQTLAAWGASRSR